jgi:hypothetical protein
MAANTTTIARNCHVDDYEGRHVRVQQRRWGSGFFLFLALQINYLQLESLPRPRMATFSNTNTKVNAASRRIWYVVFPSTNDLLTVFLIGIFFFLHDTMTAALPF